MRRLGWLCNRYFIAVHQAWHGQKLVFSTRVATLSVVRLRLFADLELLLHVHELLLAHGVLEGIIVAHARVSCFSCAYSTHATWFVAQEISKVQIESARVVSRDTVSLL